jgi:hypothetical protein
MERDDDDGDVVMVVPPVAARDGQQPARIHACNAKKMRTRNSSDRAAQPALYVEIRGEGGWVTHRPSWRRGARAPRRGDARGRRRALRQ